MLNHYMPVTIEQLIENNRAFRENYLWEAYGKKEEDKKEYSQQELEYLRIIVEKRKEEKKWQKEH